MEIGFPYFSSILFTETNILNFKQFISASYNMCRMDIAENYACFADYKYKILISFKIYVVLYQYQSTQFKKYKLINYNSSESVQNFEKDASDGQFLISLIAHND